MKSGIIFMVVLLLGLSALCLTDTRAGMDIKAGDEIYACSMPESCPCDTLALKPGKCKCGVELIKTKVTKVDGDAVYVESRGRGFKRTGGYVCGCGGACDCRTISQKQGKCVCGGEMKEAKREL